MAVIRTLTVQVLQQVTSQYKALYIEAEAQYNANKNRFPDKLPSEPPSALHSLHSTAVCDIYVIYT